MLIPTLSICNTSLRYDASLSEWIIIISSGVIGIGLADTLFFMSLNRLGAGLSAIVDCLYSPFIIILSIFWLQESLTPIQIVGSILVISAVLTTTTIKTQKGLTKKNLLLGIIYGALAMAGTAVSIVMIKPILERSPILWVTEIRLFGGIAIMLILLTFNKRRKNIIGSLFTLSSWKYTLAGSFIGTYITMMTWLGGMKFTQASIASILNQTSNIFIFIFAALLLREPITTQRIVAIVLAVSGALLVSFS